MNILACDTATMTLAVAVARDNVVLAKWQGAPVGAHAATLMPAIDRVLKEAGLSIGDMDLFAVGVGPGSFTGLRVGISTVKGLAWTLGKKVVAVSSLKALALNLKGESALVCPILDARKKEVYAALYRMGGALVETLVDETVVRPDALLSMIKSSFDSQEVVFLGEGLGVYQGLLEKEIKGARLAPSPMWGVDAGNISALAMEALEGAVEPRHILPKYLRKSEAELKRGLG